MLLCGQLVKYGLGGMTTGLADRYPDQVLTFPVCENLMNAAAMGLALAGMRPVVVHERMDFLAVGMDPLVNHIPVWPRRQSMELPVTIIAVVGKGKGQGPQHSKNLTSWFQNFEGWKVCVPMTPDEAYFDMKASIFGDVPVMYVAHRETFDRDDFVLLHSPKRIELCGASPRHEADFYRSFR